MTEASCSWAGEAATIADYLGRDQSAADEARFEEHVFSCRTCADELVRWTQIGAAVGAAVRADHVLAVVSRRHVDQLRADAVPLQEVTPTGEEVHVPLDRSMRLIIARLPGDFGGAARVDVRWYNDWDGSVTEELGVCPDRPDEVIIACGTSFFTEASGVLRSRCEITAADDPDKKPLATYHLVLDAGL